jgi:uncharacterized protein
VEGGVKPDQPPAPHFPRPAPIDAYGKGGFRFAGMSHRGSLLCLPTGIWASDIASPDQITEQGLAEVFTAAASVEHCLIGTGVAPAILEESLRQKFRENGIVVEAMSTGAAVRTYNILVGEGRRVAALLIAVP